MDDETQVPEQGNVMEKVLNTFDGLFDNATDTIGRATDKITGAGADIGRDAGAAAGSIGEKASGVADSIGTTLSENFDAAVTFTKGLFGG